MRVLFSSCFNAFMITRRDQLTHVAPVAHSGDVQDIDVQLPHGASARHSAPSVLPPANQQDVHLTKRSAWKVAQQLCAVQKMQLRQTVILRKQP